MESIRILHASDLHIANIANLKSPIDHLSARSIWGTIRHRNVATSYDPSILKAFSDFVAASHPLDAILLTGDIATTGEYADLVRAHRFIGGRFSTAWFSGYPGIFPDPELSRTLAPIWLIPGNHDRLTKTGNAFNPGGHLFHKVFNDYWTGDVRSYPVIEKDSFAVAVIGADFSLRRSRDCRCPFLNKYAQGKVYDDVLKQLVLQTNSVRSTWLDELVVLWGIHFPPNYDDISRSMRLVDEESLISAANECGVDAILSGHTHKRLNYRHEGMQFDVLCAGTVSEFQPTQMNHFQIINVWANGSRVDNYEYSRLFAEFRLV
ncbi:MAG: Calcineurin-like phosphoesterase [Blastocatellia bacterium]|jgi:3',5'-cyclic AMP phosphodiesterase CpdA|nr:Calcineurin-like phosphoesterase [Blastocatellia bacterium]